MISKKMRRFCIDDEKYCFDTEAFKTCFNKFAKDNDIQKGQLEENLADNLYLSKDAIHAWKCGNNGPGELEYIKKLSELLNVPYMYLLKKVVEEKIVEKYSVEQVESIKRVYDVIIDFLEEFDRTDGFNDLFYDFKDAYDKEIIKPIEKDENDFIDELKTYVEDRARDIYKVLKKEYFYLRNTEIFNKLWDYVDVDIDEMYNGKLEYGYRFEAMQEGTPSTEDDYLKAYKRINEIIEQYIQL